MAKNLLTAAGKAKLKRALKMVIIARKLKKAAMKMRLRKAIKKRRK